MEEKNNRELGNPNNLMIGIYDILEKRKRKNLKTNHLKFQNKK